MTSVIALSGGNVLKSVLLTLSCVEDRRVTEEPNGNHQSTSDSDPNQRL